MSRSFKKQTLILITLFLMSFSIFAGDPSWPTADTGVAWKTSKKMFMVKKVEPIGVNTAVTITKKILDNQQFQIRLDVPINKFNSGEKGRDEAVLEILQAEKQASLIFISNPLDFDRFDQILAGKTKVIAGQLKIAGRNKQVTFELKKNGAFLDGTMKSTFTHFGIKPPSVAGGVVAKVQDDLKLLAHLKIDQLRVVVGPRPTSVPETPEENET